MTERLYSCIMYVQAKPMRFYRARVFGQAPKFLPKIQALCLCRAPFAFPHFAGVRKMGQMRKAICILCTLQHVAIVRYPRGTQFRRLANSTLKEYLQKGFVLDNERLKNPDGRLDYFDELLSKIRDIRAIKSRSQPELK